MRQDLIDLADQLLMTNFVLRVRKEDGFPPDKIQEVIESFLQSINDVLLMAYKKDQLSGQKGSLQSISVSSLRSSDYTKTYAIKLSANEKELFIEPNPTSVLWTPTFFVDLMNEELALLWEVAKKKLIRLKQWDMEQFRLQYAQLYTGFILSLLSTCADQVAALDALKEIRKAPKVCFYVGAYMEKPVLLKEFSVDMEGTL